MDAAWDAAMKHFVLAAAVSGLVACGGTVTSGSWGGTGGTGGAGGEGGATTTSVACTDCLAKSFSWGTSGGFVPYTATSELAACRTFTFTRTETSANPPTSESCSLEIGGCDAAPVAVHDVEQALAHPDVVAALAGSVSLYGEDQTCDDGSNVFFVMDGKGFQVGAACSGGASCSSPDACVPVPPGVDALVQVLTDLTAQSLKVGECATKFP